MSMLHLTYQVPGDDFTRAGEASGDVKHKLKKLGYEPDAVRRVSIAMYEGEINMVIHANGGEATVDIDPDRVDIVLKDQGPGIAGRGPGHAGRVVHRPGQRPRPGLWGGHGPAQHEKVFR